jgi:hypothetical protein
MGSGALPMPDFSSTFPGPFPASPHADRTEQYLLQWLRRFPLLSSSDALRSLCNITGQGIARTLPTAAPDRLELCAALFLWLTAFDDTYAESSAARDRTRLVNRVGELTLVLAGDYLVPPSSPFPLALHDLMTRFRPLATPTQFLRLTGRIRDNLVGMVWEAHQLARPERVTVSTYGAMRPHTVFVRTIFAASEIVLGYELSEEERVSVWHLESAAADLAGWINDLASYARESARAKPLSLPTLLIAKHGHSTEEAFQHIARRCEKQAGIAQACITELSSTGSGPLRAHAEAVRHIIQSFVWHISHSRYQT